MHTQARAGQSKTRKLFLSMNVLVYSMYIPAIIIGLAAFLGAFSVWDRAKHQPDDIPMYGWGHRKLSKKDVYVGAVMLLLLGVFFFLGGLLI
jgi:hypothetical protein